MSASAQVFSTARSQKKMARRIILNLLHFLERNFLGHVAIVGWRLVGGRCSGHCHSCDFAEANAVICRPPAFFWSPELPRLAKRSRLEPAPLVASSFFTYRYRHQRQCIARRAELFLLPSKWFVLVSFSICFLCNCSLRKSRGSFARLFNVSSKKLTGIGIRTLYPFMFFLTRRVTAECRSSRSRRAPPAKSRGH